MGFVPGGVVLPLPPVLPPVPPVQGGEPGGVPEQLMMFEKVVPLHGLMIILGGLRVLGGLMTGGGITLGGGNLALGGGTGAAPTAHVRAASGRTPKSPQLRL